MQLRKTYFTVKVPTSIPEREDIKPAKPIQIKKCQRKEVSAATSLSYKHSVMLLRNLIPFFSPDSRFKSFLAFKKPSLSTRDSLTPLKLSKYVESVLDKKVFSIDKKHQRNYSSFIMAKKYSDRPKGKKNILQKLLPINKSLEFA